MTGVLGVWRKALPKAYVYAIWACSPSIENQNAASKGRAVLTSCTVWSLSDNKAIFESALLTK